jgi:sec-independent protein translocase protein TatA
MGLDNPVHILLLLIVLLLVFGARRLPEMGRSLGEGMRGFKESLSGESSRASLAAAPAPTTEPAAPTVALSASEPLLTGDAATRAGAPPAA